MLQNVYIPLPYTMEARTTGIDRSEEIARHSQPMWLLVNFWPLAQYVQYSCYENTTRLTATVQ